MGVNDVISNRRALSAPDPVLNTSSIFGVFAGTLGRTTPPVNFV